MYILVYVQKAMKKRSDVGKVIEVLQKFPFFIRPILFFGKRHLILCKGSLLASPKLVEVLQQLYIVVLRQIVDDKRS